MYYKTRVFISTAVRTSNLTSRTSGSKSLTFVVVVVVVVVAGGDILCLSVAYNCMASGTVFGNMDRRGDHQDARCMDYGK